MATVGRLGWLGIAIESVAGTPLPPTDYLPYTVNALIGKHTPLSDIMAYGIREKEFTSVVGKKWGEGKVEMLADPITAGYFFKMAFGTENKTTVETGVYAHTFTVAEVSQPIAATLTFDKGVYREWFPYSILKSFEMSVTDGLASVKTDIMSKFPVTTTSGVNTTASGITYFTFKDLSVQFGADQAAAALATPTKVKNFVFKIENNDEAIYRSGSTEPDSFAYKGFDCTGEYDLLLENAIEKDAYYGLTKRDAIFTFTGSKIGATQYEKIIIKLYNFRVSDHTIDTGIDNLFATKSMWTAEYSQSDSKTAEVICQNSKATDY